MTLGLPRVGKLPLDRFINLVWVFLTRNVADEKELRRLEARLYMPPKGVVPTVGPWTAEAETSAFQALKRSLEAGPAPRG